MSLRHSRTALPAGRIIQLAGADVLIPDADARAANGQFVAFFAFSQRLFRLLRSVMSRSTAMTAFGLPVASRITTETPRPGPWFHPCESTHTPCFFVSPLPPGWTYFPPIACGRSQSRNRKRFDQPTRPNPQGQANPRSAGKRNTRPVKSDITIASGQASATPRYFSSLSRNASSACLRSSMSSTTPRAKTNFPFGPWVAAVVARAQKGLPSLRTYRFSSVKPGISPSRNLLTRGPLNSRSSGWTRSRTCRPTNSSWAIAANATDGTIGFGDNAIANADHHSYGGLLERNPESFLARPQSILGAFRSVMSCVVPAEANHVARVCPFEPVPTDHT